MVQYGVFAAYHLALETSFLADEGASLPDLPLNSPITVALPDKTIERSISTIPGFAFPIGEMAFGSQFGVEPQRSTSLPNQGLNNVTPIQKVEMQECPRLSVPPGSFSIKQAIRCSIQNLSDSSFSEASRFLMPEERTYENLVNVRPDTGDSIMPNGLVMFPELSGQSSISNNVQNESCESDAISKNLDQSSLQLDTKQVHEEIASSKEEFPPSPSDHQSILVTLSSRCVWKGTVCERSHLFRIKYYGNFDKPLGRFLRDHLFDQVIFLFPCFARTFSKKCYVHLLLFEELQLCVL